MAKIKPSKPEPIHPDENWIHNRIGGHGGAYAFNDRTGLATIDDIYGVSRIKLFWYNMQLYFRWLKRRVKK